jgi:chemotaxis protein MotA
MKAATAIGVVVAFLACVMSALMEGTSPASFINIPAFLVIFGGTTGATMASVGMARFKLVPKLYKKAFSAEPVDLPAKVQEIVGFAERARRDGLLALESDVEEIEDPFLRKGLQLVVDGTDPDMLREILEAEIDAMSARHKSGADVFKQAGGFAPTLGVIGTCMGLVHVLQNLSQPATLGPAISGAFVATLLGVGSANVVYLPVAARLKALSEEEAELRCLLLDGILAIQSGDNPRVVHEKLMSFVPPAEREREAKDAKAAAAAPQAEPVAA